jgi:diguanylate cyclase (GGDEF)-like protein
MAIELKKANDSLRDLALRDGLTGLYNHRYFHDALASQLEASKRYGHMVSLLLIDIDFFKNINDTHGHPVGDTVLQEVSTLLVKLVRNCDIVARYGGEEFAVILPETGITGAKVLANRVRRGVEQHRINHGDIPIQITISIGVASSETYGTEISRSMLISQCDQALYEAKHSGRNRVELAGGARQDESPAALNTLTQPSG